MRCKNTLSGFKPELKVKCLTENSLVGPRSKLPRSIMYIKPFYNQHERPKYMQLLIECVEVVVHPKYKLMTSIVSITSGNITRQRFTYCCMPIILGSNDVFQEWSHKWRRPRLHSLPITVLMLATMTAKHPSSTRP